jgi:hypothetical protein
LIAVDRGEPPHPDHVAALRRLLPLLERSTVELKPVFAELATERPSTSADEAAADPKSSSAHPAQVQPSD